jgi:hypothetical protein
MDEDIFFNKIRRLYFFIFFMSVFIGCCSTIPVPKRIEENDKIFVKYLESFKNDMDGRVTDKDFNKTAIRFGNLESPTAGLCASLPVLGYSIITIDRATWDIKTELEKMELLYHELGHCVCGLPHTWEFGEYDKESLRMGKKEEGFFEDLCPVTIMYPFTIEDECLKKHWQDYIKDLYNRCYP